MLSDGEKQQSGAERRAHPRWDDPFIVVRFGGGEYSSVNWSYGGMLVGGYGGSLSAGSLVTVDSIGPAGGPMMAVKIKARVVRADPDGGTLALTFLDIDKEGFAVLAEIHG